ncbi:ABC transporter permease subunit [Dethiothermospora halolimnae]|uniref:ABC transporter permease subunit n=1 Tax=Dethiothermospora halolimnae TaxID=3114390 RepID=UPI003CCBB9F3
MKINRKVIFKIIGEILFLFILLTVIVSIIKMPKNFNIDLDIKKLDINSNVTFSHIKGEVKDYYDDLFSGTFGETKHGKNIWKYIKPGVKRTIILLISGLLISIILGIFKGVFDSKKEKEKSSNLKMITSITFLAMPTVFVIIAIQSILIWLFNSKGIKPLPIFGYSGPESYILPIICLSIIPMFYIARIVSLAIDKTYNQDYIKTAMGKGASRLRTLWVHSFRNAIIEISDSFPSIATMLISGLLLVEYMFNFPGATYMMSNNLTREPNIAIAVAIIIGIIYYVLNIIFKIIKYVVNPKAKLVGNRRG